MRTVTVLMMVTLCITGCTSEASNVGVAKDKAVDTGFTVASAGSYDSADTAVVISTDQVNSAVTFMNMDTGKQYTLYYDGTTYVKDKHDGPMTISQIKPGDVVDVMFLKGKRRLASIKRSPEAWVYDNIGNYDLGGANKTANIGASTYSLPDDVVVLSQGKRAEVMDVVTQDVVTISGIDHKIYSINVERGHGYLRLKNDQALIGGWIEVGNSVIREITEDMLLVVPEGSYQVFLSNNGASCVKDVVIDRDKEVVLDVGDMEIPENKTGKILFSVTPDTARVTVDGKAVDTEKAVELPYGIHQVHLEANGYDSLTKYIQVGSEYATISFTLEEERKEEEDKKSVSDNSLDPIPDAPSKDNSNTLESVSANTLNAAKGNKVYIDAPRNVEVYVDGNYVGMSPVSFGKTVGSHTVTLRKSGYKTRSYTIYLYNDGKDTTYSFSDLEEETVSGNSTKPDNSSPGNTSVSGNSIVTVHIEEPTGVEVYVNDVHIGTAPVSFERQAGEYTLTLRKDGCQTQSYTLYLKSERPDVTYKLDELKEEDSGHKHQYTTEKVTKEPTCTEEGEKTYTCECGDSYPETLPAKGHDFENGKCTVCGEKDKDSSHVHSYTEEITKEPTCTEEGEKTYTCECGDSYPETLPAKGHDFENGKCTVCGEKDSSHEHHYTEETTKEPTCTEEGEKTYTCECGDSRRETLPAKGHHFDENGKCTVCQETNSTETTTERIEQNSGSRRRR